MPNKSLVIESRPKPKGRKQRKDRVTVSLCGSAAGERYPPLMVGTSKNSRAFVRNGVRDGKSEAFGFMYRNQKKGWMTQQIFTEYLEEFNEKMASEGRNIAMILDNFQGHKVEDLSNVRSFFSEPNTTSHAQPFDGGIIQNFRDFFRLQMGEDLLNRLPSCRSADDYFKEITLWEACLWTVKADESVTVQTRVNCFVHCKVCKDPSPSISESPAECPQDQHDWTVVFEEEDDPFETDD